MNPKKNNFVTKFHLGKWAIRAETYIFTVCFVYYAIENLMFFLRRSRIIPPILNAVAQGTASVNHLLNLNTLIFYFLMIFFNMIIVTGLISREDLKKSPDNLREIIIPLIATLNLLSFNLIRFLPAKGNLLVIPEGMIPLVSIIGALISTTGIIISILAMLKLRKSFGIFVQVHPIICTGVYKYVRHPIYLGYFLDFIGYSLLHGRLYYFLLAGLSMMVFIYRAKLEEKKLAQHSEEYRAYMKKTPSIWPKVTLG